MKKIIVLALALLIPTFNLSVASPKSFGQKGRVFQTENAVPNRYIVVMNEKYTDSFGMKYGIESEAFQLAGSYGADVKRVYSAAIKGFAAEMSEEAAELLSTDERVLYVEEDAIVTATNNQTNADWGLDRIDQRALPLNSSYTFDGTGYGVHAYVVDSGIRVTHQDFGGRATVAFDARNDGQNGLDCFGHGTHVAGIIGGATNGVAKNVTLHSVRVLGCDGTGLISDIMAGIDWITANHQSPAVVNMSIGFSGTSNAFDALLNGSINAGLTWVVSAGNMDRDACNYSPSRIPAAITVGSTDSTDSKAWNSNWGACVDLFAPGEGITSTYFTSDTATRVMGGTSMAAPMVAGAAAIYLQSNPNATPAQVSQSITSTTTNNMLNNVGTNSPNKLIYSSNMAPTAGDAVISGRVMDQNGSGVRGVKLTLMNLTSGEMVYAATNQMGNYMFEGLDVSEFYVLSAEHRKFWIQDNTRSIMLLENVTGMNFFVEPW